MELGLLTFNSREFNLGELGYVVVQDCQYSNASLRIGKTESKLKVNNSKGVLPL